MKNDYNTENNHFNKYFSPFQIWRVLDNLKPTLGYRCSLSWGKKALLSCCRLTASVLSVKIFNKSRKKSCGRTEKLLNNWETTTELAWNLRRVNTMLRKTNEEENFELSKKSTKKYYSVYSLHSDWTFIW